MSAEKPNLPTWGAIDAYREEWKYFANEADNFLQIVKKQFEEDQGQEEAKLIDWKFVERYFLKLRYDPRETGGNQ